MSGAACMVGMEGLAEFRASWLANSSSTRGSNRNSSSGGVARLMGFEFSTFTIKSPGRKRLINFTSSLPSSIDIRINLQFAF